MINFWSFSYGRFLEIPTFLGGQGALPPLNIWQLTLFPPGRAEYPHLLPMAPPMFFTFRHHWTMNLYYLSTYELCSILLDIPTYPKTEILYGRSHGLSTFLLTFIFSFATFLKLLTVVYLDIRYVSGYVYPRGYL